MLVGGLLHVVLGIDAPEKWEAGQAATLIAIALVKGSSGPGICKGSGLKLCIRCAWFEVVSR